jgi:hypothetical protein
MEEDSEEKYKKLFENIIDSNDLEDVYEEIKKERAMTFKEVILLQQELATAVANVADMIYCNVHLDHDLEIAYDSFMHSTMSALYKIALDFNESVVESIFEEIDLDDDEEEDNE